MFLARKLMRKKSGPSFAMTSHSFNVLPVNSGVSWGGTATVSGGTAPYTYALLVGGVVQYQTTTSATTSSIGGTALQGWNGLSAQLRITDSLGAVVTSPFQAVTVYWISGSSISLSSTSPHVGNIISCTMNVTSANPAPSSYAWQYQYKPSGGSWGAWTNFAGNAQIAYTGAFTQAGDQWSFKCTATNAAGSVASVSATVTVIP